MEISFEEARMPRPPRRVSFSNTSTLCVVENETKGLETELWYTKEDIELENLRISHSVNKLRTTFDKSDDDSTISSEDATPNGDNASVYACDIIGLDKYLTVELTEEYRARRKGRTQAVLHEQRMARRRSSMSDLSGSGSLSSMLSNLSVSASMNSVASAASESDEDALARVARRHSKWARRRARAMALFLEKDEGHHSSRASETKLASGPYVSRRRSTC